MARRSMAQNETTQPQAQAQSQSQAQTGQSYLYPPRENGCPRCGDKLRTDGKGGIICSIGAPDCPRLAT